MTNGEATSLYITAIYFIEITITTKAGIAGLAGPAWLVLFRDNSWN